MVPKILLASLRIHRKDMDGLLQGTHGEPSPNVRNANIVTVPEIDLDEGDKWSKARDIEHSTDRNG